jgi:CRISPR-associated protein Cas2
MRYHTLVSYDICEPKRLQKVHSLMQGYGNGFQYSVFICQLSEKDFALLMEKLKDIINHNEDQIVMIKLAPAIDDKDFDDNWIILGKKLAAKKSKDFIC